MDIELDGFGMSDIHIKSCVWFQNDHCRPHNLFSSISSVENASTGEVVLFDVEYFDVEVRSVTAGLQTKLI